MRVGHATKPEALANLDAEIAGLERATKAIERDVEDGEEKRRAELDEKLARLEEAKAERDELEARWRQEMAEVEALLKERGELEEEEGEEGAEAEGGDAESAGAKPAEPVSATATGAPAMVGGEAQPVSEAPAAPTNNDPDDDRLIHIDVDADAVAATVSSWTGVPLGKMKRNAVGNVLALENKLRERVKGQEPAVGAVSEACRMSFAGVRNPDAPVGVFLFVGPSGVGKTETALALADELYGGERFVTQINMSEYQDKSAVSGLIGSRAGLVGYGEGGILTNAVRQRPYSVVLLDEAEKADPEVLNVFYQTFDKGEMNDSEGRLVNFRNTIIILTSNLATDEIMEAYSGDTVPETKEVVEKIQPILSKWFKPALLARMTVVPYRPIDPETMKAIAKLKLRKLAKRIAISHGIETVFQDELVDDLTQRCTNSEAGARNVDHILRSSLTPMIAQGLLEKMAEDQEPTAIEVSIAPSGEWRVDIDVA